MPQAATRQHVTLLPVMPLPVILRRAIALLVMHPHRWGQTLKPIGEIPWDLPYVVYGRQ